MASGIYGRRVVEPQISDHSLFLEDRFLMSGADRKLSSELENVWDKVSDAKAVLQKLEHRMEVTKDANKAENLAFKMTPVSLPKNTPEKVPTIRAVPSALRGSPAVKGGKLMSTSNRTNNHKVAFHEPLVLYHEDFGPVPAGRLVSTRSPLHSNSNSFVVRDLRSNDFDVSRVTMRDKTGTVQSRINSTGFSADETITPTKGTVIPPRVLNDPSKNVSNLKSKPVKSGRDLKSAGVAKTVTHFDPKQVYKYLEKEGIRKHNEKTNHRGKDVGRHAPLLLDSPYAPYKRIDIVKQKKGLQQNSEALARLKEKIQKQKERSPSSMDSSLAFAYSSTHKEDDPIAPKDSATGESKEKPRMRKIAQGPAAPKYKGFSATETKIRTPDGKVWKAGEENNPYIPTRVFPDDKKKSRAVSSLFNDNKGKSKLGLSSGRLKGPLMNKAKSSQSKNQRLVRKTGKICPEDPAHKKSLITPSSWREGQKVAESILGPLPKHRKKTTEKDLKRPYSPPTHDTDLHSHKKLQSHTTSSKRPDIGNSKSAADASSKSNKNASANFIPETGTEINEHNGLKINDELVESHALVRAQPTKSGTSIKASIPREKLSPSVQGILDDLHLSSSDSDEESTATEKDEQAKEPAKIQHSARGRSGVSRKNLSYKDSKPSSENKAPKVRHYNQNQVQQYIAKQKADRKRKQSQERKNEKEAQERRQKQLIELYRKQKDAAVAKKNLSEAGKNRPVLQDSYVKSSDTTAAQAMQKINDILTEPSGWKTTNTDSDKENTQEFQQPSSKFDEKMSAFMEKLNQYEVPSETMTETDRKTPAEHVISQDKDKGSSQVPIYSSTSEFMQKLDRYLNDDGPATSARLTMQQSKTSYASDSVTESRRDPNLLIEDLDMHTSPSQLNSNRRSFGIHGDPSGTYSPRFAQASSGMGPLLPTEDNLARQKSKAERIAALKTKAESLQDRIQTESKRLMDNPIVSVQPRLDEIDSILARSGVWSTSPQWLPETTDYRQSKPRWQSSSSWDVPDSARSRGGLNDISPSQLPGVAGLRHHVTANAENKKEMDAACKIQSAYRGHVVRRAMDTWKLPSGLSMTEVRRQATSTHSFHCNGEQDFEDDNYISEGPLSLSRSDTVVSDGAENLRSVEEILKEMKEKEYCVADSIPIASTTPEWQREIDYDEQELGSQRNTFLADLESRLDSARSRENSSKRSHVEENKPPWERSGGDKYSLINVFTSKYLRTLKKQGTDDNKLDDEPSRKDPLAHVALDSKDVITPKTKVSSGVNSISKSSDREIIDPLSSPISENISEDSDSSITPRSLDIDGNKNNISSPTHRFAPQIQAGKVSYSSSDDGDREPSHTMKPSSVSEHKDEIKDYSLSFSDTETDPKLSHSPLASRGIELPPAALPFMKQLQPKVFSVLDTNEKKYSPAALEQRMAAELNYQEAVEESLRHLTGVERTQGVSLAQQETVSLAQLLKARQLQHEVEMERLTIKAKEEALEAEEKRREDRMKEERLQLEENLKLQQATRKSLKTQAEAARLTAKAAERLSYGVNRSSDRHDFPDSYSSYGATGTITRQKDSSSSNGSDDSVAIRKDNINGKESQRRSPSLMSEHSTTSLRLSDNDSHSSIPEQLPSTEEEDAKQKMQFRKDVKDKSDGSDPPLAERKTTAADKNDSSDRSISEDLAVGGDTTTEGSIKTSMDKKASTDHPSDSSEYSVCFDETLTEDEIAEISRRVVVPSESHRRHQRRRSPHGTLDKSDISSDDQPSSTRQKTPRSTGTGLDDFSIGPSLSGTAESEFAQFMNTMVRRYMLEEEVRSKHQAAMLKLRERAIKEKTDSELAWLKQQKQQIRNKGEDDKMPPIRKKQRAILLRLKVETDEIKKLQAVRKAASHERKLFLQQQENTLRRSKTRQPEESKDRESGMGKARPRPQGGTSDGQMKSSTPVPKLDIRSSPDADDVSELPSDLDISSASSVLLKKLKKHIPSKIEERRLTTREQRLLERRKQAEQLIAWKRRLDKEEKKIYDIEKKAISAWEKDSDLKADLPFNAEQSPLRQKSEDAETQHLLKDQDSSIVDESSSAKSPNSENHFSPPPPSHSESSIAEEIIQINSGTNSSRSVVSSTHEDKSVQRNQEESSDGTNAEEYSQSFESMNTPQQTPRSPKLQDTTPKQEKLSTVEKIKSTKKEMKEEPERTGKADSPASTPLLPPYARSDKPVTVQPGKLTGQKDGSSRRKESVESWSDESFSQTQSETEHSDIECRVRALKEELKRRRSIAERLKKEQKRRHKDRLKAQEASLRSQIEAYDVFIRKTQTELTQELDHQLAVSNTPSSAGNHVPVAKPQIRSPRKTDQARQSARSLRSTTAASVSPEASPRSGSTRPTAAVSFLNKNRTESESSGKSSRSLSFEDDDKTAEETTPNGSIKSLVGSQTSPLPSKQEKLPMSHSHTPSPTTPISDKVPVERPKRLDLTEATATLSKLAKPSSVNGSLVLVGNAQRSQIPVASRTPSTSSSSSAKLPGSPTQTVKSHIPVPVSASSSLDRKPLSVSPIQKQITSPPSPGLSENYSEDFELSAGSKKNQEDGSIATEDDISEHFSDSSTATDKSNKSEAMLDLSTPSKPKTSDVVENKDDSLLGLLDLAEAKHVKTEEEDEEKTPVISPSQTPVMSPRTPTMEQESKQEISPQKFSIGDRVLLAGRESGIVRFIGETDFANGIWVGAELELPKGKNDGSVFNIRYFDCQPKHGLFAPVDRVTLLSPETSPSSLEKNSKESKEHENSTESELSKAISDAAKNFETFVKDLEEPDISTVEKDHGTSIINRDRLAEDLSNKLLNSLLQDSVTTVLDSHASKQKKEEEIEEQKDDSELEVTGETSIDDEPALPTPVKNFLEMLSTDPASMEEDIEEEEDDGSVPATTNESLAETFTGDLLADTLSKVLEIRRQRAKKWAEMSEVHETSDDESHEPKHQRDLDNGREVEEILQDGKPSSMTSGKAEVIGQVTENERDREAPVRPVSPVWGTSQDEVAEEWFDEDFGISDFHKMKPNEAEEGHEEDDIWQDGRLIEVLSSRLEPPPPVFLVPHKQQHILRLIEEAVEYYYSKHLRGELSSDVRIPDFLYKDHPNEVSEKEETDEAVDEEKLDSDRNTNQVFKTSLFDLVRELISEIYSTKTTSEEMKSRPPWLKKKTVHRPSYCRRVPKTGEELLTVISKQVSDLLNLQGEVKKLDPKVTMKWGSRKKKDKVDLILIQELREEEPEWTNYDEDETTVKMQLTDTVLDMLISDTVMCFEGIERKKIDRNSAEQSVHITRSAFSDGSVSSGDDRSQ